MPNSNNSKTPWQRIRKFFNDIHLWGGLASGLVLIVVCFTGTVYVYNTEIREAASSHLYQVQAESNAQKLGINALVEKTKNQIDGNIIAVTVPYEADRSIQFNVKKEGDESRNGTTYFVNPYTAAILGNNSVPTKTDEFMKDMFSLHRWLMLDRIEKPIFGELPNKTLGSYITGTATILFTIGVITGMIIWFPQRIRNWKKGLKIKWGNWKRVNHDVHNTLAFYSIIFLFMMGVTGPYWSFPWYKDGIKKALGTYEVPVQKENQQNSESNKPENLVMISANSVDFETLFQKVDQNLDYKGSYRVNLPQKPDEPIMINKNKVGFFAPAASDKISFDANLAVTEVQIFSDKPFSERVSSSIKALHTGSIYGHFTKLLYFLACLVATSLPITGTLIWVNKMKKKKKPTKVNVRMAA